MTKRRSAKTEETHDAAWTVRGTISKVDSEQRRAFGWASVISNESGTELVFDHQNTVIPVEELENAAYEYVRKSRDASDMHEERGVATLIESIVVTPEKRQALGLPAEGKIGWFVGFEISDPDVWERVKSGELSEFSIGGSAEEVRVA